MAANRNSTASPQITIAKIHMTLAALEYLSGESWYFTIPKIPSIRLKSNATKKTGESATAHKTAIKANNMESGAFIFLCIY